MNFRILLHHCLVQILLLCFPVHTVKALEGDFLVQELSGDLTGATLQYRVNLSDANANGEDTITIIFSVPFVSWLGVGITPNGRMVGSEVVLGFPDNGEVKKFIMNGKNSNGIVELSEQTLIDTSLTQSNGVTTLTYTKILIEQGELAINANGENQFTAAYGWSNRLSYHRGKDVFYVDISTTTTTSSPTIAPVLVTSAPTTSPFVSPTTSPSTDDTGAPTSAAPIALPTNPISVTSVPTTSPSTPPTISPSTVITGAPTSTAPMALPTNPISVTSVPTTSPSTPPTILPSTVITGAPTSAAPIALPTNPMSVTIPPTTSPSIPSASKDPTATPVAAPTNLVDFELVELERELEGSTLSYRFNLNDEEASGQNTITIIVSVPVIAWVGVASSSTGSMIGSEAVIGLPDTGEVKKYFLLSTVDSGIVEMPTEQQTLINAKVTQTGGRTTLTYTKILAEEGEIIIDAEGRNIFLSAYGYSNVLSYHQAKGVFSLTGEAIISSRDDTLWVVHGWLAAFAWGAVCPMAIMAGIFRQIIPGDTLWLNIHRGLNSLVLLLTLAAVIIAVVAINNDVPDGFEAKHFNADLSDGHRLIGLIIFILVLVQVIIGIFRPHPPKMDGQDNEGASPEEKSSMRVAWETGHRLLGIVLLSLSWYQIQLGIKWYNEIFNDGDSDTALDAFWGTVVTLSMIIAVGLVLRLIRKSNNR